MRSESQPAGEPASSPGPSWMGCLLPIAGLAVVLGLGPCVFGTGWLMNREIGAFADAEPRAFGRGQPVLAAGAAQALDAKLLALEAAARDGRRLEIALSAPELNHLLQTRPLLASLRDSTRILRVGKTGLEVESSQPVRKLGGGMRYLNGVFVFRPTPSATNAWQLELQDLRLPGKQVPAGFLKTARELHLFRFDLGAAELQEVLRQVERVDLEEGRVVVVTRS